MSVSILPEVTEKVRPPRALLVERPLGYPLDRPHDGRAQRAVIDAALALTARRVSEPLLVPFEPLADDASLAEAG